MLVARLLWLDCVRFSIEVRYLLALNLVVVLLMVSEVARWGNCPLRPLQVRTKNDLLVHQILGLLEDGAFGHGGTQSSICRAMIYRGPDSLFLQNSRLRVASV